MRQNLILAIALLFSGECIVLHPCLGEERTPTNPPANFSPANLVAWCIVPFDAKQRGSTERAAMVKDLGMRRVAYDWRAEHVPTFEAEILAYRGHDLEYFAFWNWHDDMEPLIRRHKIRPQIWRTCKTTIEGSDEQKITDAANQLVSLAKKTRELGLRLGLYNHGGWAGEPYNLVAVCERLRRDLDSDHIGIVYNFHHGHSHVANFDEHLATMMPYLLCVNLNGMAKLSDANDPHDENKIVTIGDGENESKMIRQLIQSGYQGPVGIIGHRREFDVEQVLRGNLDGLQRILHQMPPDAIK